MTNEPQERRKAYCYFEKASGYTYARCVFCGEALRALGKVRKARLHEWEGRSLYCTAAPGHLLLGMGRHAGKESEARVVRDFAHMEFATGTKLARELGVYFAPSGGKIPEALAIARELGARPPYVEAFMDGIYGSLPASQWVLQLVVHHAAHASVNSLFGLKGVDVEQTGREKWHAEANQAAVRKYIAGEPLPDFAASLPLKSER